MKIYDGMQTSDGAGVKLYRIIGTPKIDHADPFLLLDEFKSDDSDDYIAGFPDHPHRGFETLTYMKNGRFRHKDSTGGEGLLEDGGVQWMTAGKGIIHSEIPEMTTGQLWGYQLWLNLPSKLKMIEPSYQDIQASDLPIYNGNDFSIKVIAGCYENLESPAHSHYDITYFDVELSDQKEFQYDLPEGYQLLVYVYSGRVTIAGEPILDHQIAAISITGPIEITATESNTGFLFIAAKPIGEPVVRYGPFVMNTQEEIQKAIMDYNSGNLV